MTQYVLNVIEPVMEPGITSPPEFLEPIMRNVNAVSDRDQGCRRVGDRSPARHGPTRPRSYAIRTARR